MKGNSEFLAVEEVPTDDVYCLVLDVVVESRKLFFNWPNSRAFRKTWNWVEMNGQYLSHWTININVMIACSRFPESRIVGIRGERILKEEL